MRYAELAAHLSSKPKFFGTLVIVCWRHGKIPELGLALGATAAQLTTAPEIRASETNELKWNPLVFDRFWILDFADDGGVAFQTVPQQSGP